MGTRYVWTTGRLCRVSNYKLGKVDTDNMATSIFWWEIFPSICLIAALVLCDVFNMLHIRTSYPGGYYLCCFPYELVFFSHLSDGNLPFFVH